MNSPKELDNSAVNDSGLETNTKVSETDQVHEILSRDANSESGSQTVVSDVKTELPGIELVEAGAGEGSNSGSVVSEADPAEEKSSVNEKSNTVSQISEPVIKMSADTETNLSVSDSKPVVSLSNDQTLVEAEKSEPKSSDVEAKESEVKSDAPQIKMDVVESEPVVLKNETTVSFESPKIKMDVVESEPIVLLNNETVVPAETTRIKMEEVDSGSLKVEGKSDESAEIKVGGVKEIETLPPVLRALVTGQGVDLQREDTIRIRVQQTLTARQIDLLSAYVQQNPDFNPDKIETNVQLNEFLRSNLILNATQPVSVDGKPNISSTENKTGSEAETRQPVDLSKLLASAPVVKGPEVIEERLEFVSTSTSLSVAQLEAANAEAARTAVVRPETVSNNSKGAAGKEAVAETAIVTTKNDAGAGAENKTESPTPQIVDLNSVDRISLPATETKLPPVHVLADVMEIPIPEQPQRLRNWYLYEPGSAVDKSTAVVRANPAITGSAVDTTSIVSVNPVTNRSSASETDTTVVTRAGSADNQDVTPDLPRVVSGTNDAPVSTVEKPLPNILARLVRDAGDHGDSVKEVAPEAKVISISERPHKDPILVTSNLVVSDETIITAPEIVKLQKSDISDIRNQSDAQIILSDRSVIAHRLGYSSEVDLNSATFNKPQGETLSHVSSPAINDTQIVNANSWLDRARANVKVTQPEFAMHYLPTAVASDRQPSNGTPADHERGAVADTSGGAKPVVEMAAVTLTEITKRPIMASTLPTENRLVSNDSILTGAELDRLAANGIRDENVAAERFPTRKQIADFLGFQTVADLNNADFNKSNGVPLPTIDGSPIERRHASLADTVLASMRENTRDTQPQIALTPTFISGEKRELSAAEFAQLVKASTPVVNHGPVVSSGEVDTLDHSTGNGTVVSNDRSPVLIGQDSHSQTILMIRPDVQDKPVLTRLSSTDVRSADSVCSGDTCPVSQPDKPSIGKTLALVVDQTNATSRVASADSYTPEQLVQIQRLGNHIRPEKLEGLSGQEVSALYAATVSNRPVVTAASIPVSQEPRPERAPFLVSGNDSFAQKLAEAIKSHASGAPENGTRPDTVTASNEIAGTSSVNANFRQPQISEIVGPTTKLSALLAGETSPSIGSGKSSLVDNKAETDRVGLVASTGNTLNRMSTNLEFNQSYFSFLDSKNYDVPNFQSIARLEDRIDAGFTARGYSASVNSGSTVDGGNNYIPTFNLSRSSVQFDGSFDVSAPRLSSLVSRPTHTTNSLGFDSSGNRIDSLNTMFNSGKSVAAIFDTVAGNFSLGTQAQFDYGLVRKFSESYVASDSAKSAVSHNASLQVTGSNIKVASVSDMTQSFMAADSGAGKAGFTGVSFVNIITGSIVDSSVAGANAVKLGGVAVSNNVANVSGIIASDGATFDGGKSPVIGIIKVDGQNVLVGTSTSGSVLATRIDISSGTPRIDGKAINISLEGLVNVTKVDLSTTVKAINTHTANGVAVTSTGIKQDAGVSIVKSEHTGNHKPDSTTKADSTNTVKGVENTIQVAKTFINHNTAPQLIAAIKYGEKLPEGMTYENGYIKLVHNGQVLYFPGLKAALKFVEGLGIQVEFDEDDDDGQWHVESLDAKGSSSRVQYVVVPGDTLESIAEQRLGDVRYKDLIVTINRSEIVYRSIDGIKAPFVYPSQLLWLPSRYELKVFRKNFFTASETEVSKSSSVKCDRSATISLPRNRDEVEATGLLKKLHEEVVEHYKPKSTPQSNFGPESGPLANALDRVRFAGGRESVNLDEYPQSVGKLSQRQFHQVVAGDTLISIAVKSESLGDTRFWKLIAKVNGLTTRLDAFGIPCEALVPGQHLLMPDQNEIAQFARQESINHPLLNIEPRSRSLSGNDTVVTSEVEVFSFAPDCRVTAVNYSSNREDFCVSLQYQDGACWKTIASYQSTSNGKAVRTTYAKHGVTSSLVIDLPPSVVREMAIEEFSKSWSVRTRAYAQGSAIDTKNYFVPSIPQLKAKQH